jgi:parallel beta-helix repeat protein
LRQRADVQSDFGWTNGFTGISVQNCFVNGCGVAVYLEIGNPVYYGQSFLIHSNYFTNVLFGLLASFNDVSEYPMALGSITLSSNVISLDANQPGNLEIPEAALSIGTPNNEAAIPQIPSVTVQFNHITTAGGGYPRWGIFLGNMANALVTDNTLDNSYYGISMRDAHTTELIDGNALRMPISYLSAQRNRNGSQLVGITPWGTTASLPSIGTQQKGDFFLGGYASLLWRNATTGQNVFWPMEGTNTKSCGGGVLSNGVVALAGNWVISGTADFTGDCNNDILWTMPGTTNVLLWTMQGPSFICSNWLRALSNSASSYGIAGTGDLNGDGKADLVITNAFGTIIRLMNGTNWIQDIPLSNAPPASNAQIVGVGEFTGSEQADILWRDYTTGSNFLWIMQGTNVLGTTNLAKLGDTNWRVQGVGDFNGDGIADIVWRHAVTGSNEIWLTSNPLSTNYTPVILSQLANLNWAIAGPK